MIAACFHRPSVASYHVHGCVCGRGRRPRRPACPWAFAMASSCARRAEDVAPYHDGYVRGRGRHHVCMRGRGRRPGGPRARWRLRWRPRGRGTLADAPPPARGAVGNGGRAGARPSRLPDATRRRRRGYFARRAYAGRPPVATSCDPPGCRDGTQPRGDMLYFET